jgi:O-antigen/teichoic acid export membrane protein
LFERRQYFYLPLLLCASGLLLLKSGVYARLLAVEEFGALSAALLVINTAVSFGALGFNHLAHKLLPRLHADADHHGRAAFLGASITVFLGVILTSALLAGIAGLLFGVLTPRWVLVTTAAAFTQFVFALQLIGVKSAFRFVEHASWSLARAVALVGAGAVVAWATQSAQLVVLTEALVSAAMLWPMRRLMFIDGHPLEWRSAIRDAARAHLGPALQLLKLQGMITVIYMLDRWIGLSVLSAREFGIYSVALIVLMAFENLQAIIGVPAYPVLSSFISRNDHAAGYRHAFYISARLLLLGAALGIPAVWVLDWLIAHFLPQYQEASAVIHLTFAAGVLRVSNFFGTFCILADQERLMFYIAIAIALTAVLAAVTLHGLGVKLGPIQVATWALLISAASLTADFVVARRVALRRRVPQA